MSDKNTNLLGGDNSNEDQTSSLTTGCLPVQSFAGFIVMNQPPIGPMFPPASKETSLAQKKKSADRMISTADATFFSRIPSTSNSIEISSTSLNSTDEKKPLISKSKSRSDPRRTMYGFDNLNPPIVPTARFNTEEISKLYNQDCQSRKEGSSKKHVKYPENPYTGMKLIDCSCLSRQDSRESIDVETIKKTKTKTTNNTFKVFAQTFLPNSAIIKSRDDRLEQSVSKKPSNKVVLKQEPFEKSFWPFSKR